MSVAAKAIAGAMRRGWCPSLAHPMQSGDGLIVRLHPRGAALSLAQVEPLAEAAERFGNGLVDLTQRGNLQLRGLRPERLDALGAQLRRSGLAEDGDEAPADILVSPLAGIDASAALDPRPVAAALREGLARDPALRGLPEKFSFVVDGGGVLSLGAIAADIRLDAFACGGEARVVVRLAGTAAQASLAGTCAPSHAADVAIEVARRFMCVRGDGMRHMAEALAAFGTRVFDGIDGLVAADAPPPPAPTGSRDVIGPRAFGRQEMLGVAAPFGRLSADCLHAVADAMRAAGVEELRVTPWRALLLPCDAAQARAMGARLAAAGLIASQGDPRLDVAACSGLDACVGATTDVRADAARFAPLVAPLAANGIKLHVSGCAKGCASAQAAPFTLVGRDGAYDVVLGGKAQDAPHRAGLTPHAAAAFIAGQVLEQGSR